MEKLIPEAIGKEIEKQCQGIFPSKGSLIRKVKILRKATHPELGLRSARQPLLVGALSVAKLCDLGVTSIFFRMRQHVSRLDFGQFRKLSFECFE